MSEETLPPGWALAKFEDILIDPKADLVDGPFGSNLKSSEYVETGVPVLKIQNIKADRFLKKHFSYVTDEKAKELSRHSFVAGDLIITKLGDPLGLCCEVPHGFPAGVFVADLMRLRLRANNIAKRFLLLAINSQVIQSQFRKITKGTTRPRVNLTIVRSLVIPVPPFGEQKRIVAKIEELFSELDAGEESLRKARQQLGTYRQSLLKQAFEGKLTETWRKQNPDKLVSPELSDVPFEELEGFAELPPAWRYMRFGRSISHIDAGKSFRCEERRPAPQEIGVAKVSAVTWGEYDEAESKTCIDPKKVNPGYFIRVGDFIVSRANTIELVGACVIVRKVTQRVMLSDKTLRLTIDDALKPFFLHYLRSRNGRREIEKRSTGNQESMRNIGQDRIRSIIVPECSLPEQQEIVRLLDAQFEVIERNEREIDAALKKSEALRQSILHRAFTGRLVPQDPSDEPASELLARLRAERAANIRTTRSKS